MGNGKCTAWLSSLTVLCYLCIYTCMCQSKLQYIHTDRLTVCEQELLPSIGFRASHEHWLKFLVIYSS